MKFNIQERKTGYLKVSKEIYGEFAGISMYLKTGSKAYRIVYINDWIINEAREKGKSKETIQLLVQAQFEDYFIVYIEMDKGPE